MNKPPKGNNLRLNNAPQLMFSVKALNDSNNPMKVRVTEGSFWLNNSQFIEVVEQNSPIITAPVSGAKWVLVYIDKAGVVKLSHGLATAKSSPPQPTISRDSLPLAFVFVKSGTTQITQDLIFPCHSFLNAGNFAQQHNELSDRDVANCHSISAITNLEEVLGEKISRDEMKDLLYSKSDSNGTPSTTFTLNQDHSGFPLDFCGIQVNRGTELSVGLRFNEDIDEWQYTNDGVEWHNLSNDKDLYDYATNEAVGMVQLSVAPVTADKPVVIGENDPRIADIKNKLDKKDIQQYYNKDEINALLQNKINNTDVYSKYDAENVFVTRAEYSTGSVSGYTKLQINDLLALKANSNSVYTKTEITDMLEQYYTKTEIDNAIAQIPTNNNTYTVAEVDSLIRQLSNTVYNKTDVDSMITDVEQQINTKADINNVYTKMEIDTKLSALPSTSNPSNPSDLSNYYNIATVNSLLDTKAPLTHNHNVSDIIEDTNHRFVSDSEKEAWNNKQNTLTFTPEDSANKGQANGYASLDINGRIPISQLPVGYASSSNGGTEIIGTYADLLAIPQPESNKLYFVTDASGDVTVNNGSASYIYNNQWIKVSEQESMDVVLDWNNIQNKPASFTPDTALLTDYAKINNVYTKTEVDDLLDGKAESVHTHDSRYLKLSAYDTFKVGNYRVNESNIADGMVLCYDDVNNELKYKAINTINNSDAFIVGNYNVVEPSDLKANYSLVFDGSSLTYRDMRNYVGSVQVDESDIASDKVLAYDGTKLVYKPIAESLNIDNTNKQNGYILSYNADNDKLEYTAPTVVNNCIYTYTVTAENGQKCIVRANKENAITYIVNGNHMQIIKDGSAEIYMLQLFVKAEDHQGTASAPATITIDMKSDSIADYATYDGIMPTVGYYAMDSTRRFMTNNIAFDMEAMGVSNPLRMKITNIATYNYVVKINF